ncbi:MAG: T9SS type A sorting domain-containing protein [Bacteroidia bacterium]|nr:T9SS type A sorting domain-containing protein [Bacteroidia bacterium]
MKFSEILGKRMALLGLPVLLIMALSQDLYAQFPLPQSSPLDLLPTHQASHVVQNSGNWSDPNTWGGSLPTNLAKIHIPSGKSLTIDGEISTRIKIIRNDGKLAFATHKNTALKVETIVQGMMGELELGTANKPIPAGISCKITIVDEGDINLNTDQWEKGLVLMGKTVAYGAAKTAWVELATNPRKGENSLILKSAPSGWEVGDRIVITGTDIADPKSDEVAVIQAISGKTVSLDQALVRNHLSPASDLFVHVANLDRNIVIQSENATDTLDRGHIMFMHTLDVDFNYVKMFQMGRSRKDIPINDWTIGESDQFVNGSRSNIRGRYSVHFHRGGVKQNMNPAYLRGCVVEEDPGWAYASHSAFVHFDNNVSYKVIGGAFQTEAGDELGSFTNNIAIQTVNEDFPLRFEAPENAPDTRENAQDFAFQGDGFWVHGGGVSLSGNVAAGCSGHGFIYWPEGLIEPGSPTNSWRNTFDPANIGLPQLHFDHEINELATGWVKIAGFEGNVTYASSIGFSSYYLHTTFFGDQSDYDATYIDTLHSTLKDFTAWNIYNTGIELNFTERVTFDGVRMVNGDANQDSKGIWASMYRIMNDIGFKNISIEGFGTGIGLPPQGQITVSCGNLKNGTNFYIPSPTLKPRDLLIHGLATTSDPAFSNPAEIRMEASFSPPEDKYPAYFLLPDRMVLNYGPFSDQRLYFDEQAANYTPLPGDTDPYTFFDGERYILSEFAGKTNQQLQNDYQMSFGGSLLPSAAVSSPGIIGGKIAGRQNEAMNVPVCVDLIKETRWDLINACITDAGTDKVERTLLPYVHDVSCIGTTSNQEKEMLSGFSGKVYPNPSYGNFQIEAPFESYRVMAYGLDGRLIEALGDFRGIGSINASHWKAGIYFLRVYDRRSSQTMTYKLIKLE